MLPLHLRAPVGLVALLASAACGGRTEEVVPPQLKRLIEEQPPAARSLTPYRLDVPALAHPGVDLSDSSFSSAGMLLSACVNSFSVNDREHLVLMSEDEGRSWVDLPAPESALEYVECTDSGPVAWTREGDAMHWEPALRRWEPPSQRMAYYRLGNTLVSFDEKGLLLGGGQQWKPGAQFPSGWRPGMIEAIEPEGEQRALAWLWEPEEGGRGFFVSGPRYGGAFRRLQVEGVDPAFAVILPGHGLVIALPSGALKESKDLGDHWADYGHPYPWVLSAGGESVPVQSLAAVDTQLLVGTSAGSFSYDVRERAWRPVRGLPSGAEPPRFVPVGQGRVLAVMGRGLYFSRGADPFQQSTFRRAIEIYRVDAARERVLIRARPTLGREGSTLWRSTDFGNTWQPELNGEAIYGLATAEKDVLALTRAGLQVGSRGGGRWEAWSPWDPVADGQIGPLAPSGGGQTVYGHIARQIGGQIALSASGAYRLRDGKVSRMRRQDKAWQDIAAGLEDVIPRWLAATPDAVFVATKEEVYILDESRQAWRAMGVGWTDISLLVASGPTSAP